MKKNYETPSIVVELIDAMEIETSTSNVLYWWGQDPNAVNSTSLDDLLDL